ncbi:MAG: wax ester/triacylglycerol synthase family O-acyltransferase [Steroidobacteraceae bacterium]
MRRSTPCCIAARTTRARARCWSRPPCSRTRRSANDCASSSSARAARRCGCARRWSSRRCRWCCPAGSSIRTSTSIITCASRACDAAPRTRTCSAWCSTKSARGSMATVHCGGAPGRGPQGGAAALVIKMSHAIADGVGAQRLFEAIFSTGPEPPAEPMPPLPIPEDVTPEELTRSALGRNALSLARAAVSAGRGLRRLGGGGAAGDPAGRVAAARAYADSAARIMSPAVPPVAAFAQRGNHRRCVALDVPLAALRRAAQRPTARSTTPTSRRSPAASRPTCRNAARRPKRSRPSCR